ncbi:hypothetical protein CEXT_676911 [Caerostris extrusa]|uniref:LAGLIDADG homing endonuclease n=1 Tax=Caerostris extrusa TaxID=172846 RepID=A0AAV4Q321_CAEEX|nr:hypothetical protein CEXT_676911 [Caerostris extrusa]
MPAKINPIANRRYFIKCWLLYPQIYVSPVSATPPKYFYRPDDNKDALLSSALGDCLFLFLLGRRTRNLLNNNILEGQLRNCRKLTFQIRFLESIGHWSNTLTAFHEIKDYFNISNSPFMLERFIVLKASWRSMQS